jgi:hypothetical protein
MSRKCSGFVIVMLVAALDATLLAQVQGSKSAGKSNDTEQKLSQMEKDLWEAWKNHDVERFKKAMAPLSVNVSSGGVAGTEQAVAPPRACTWPSPTLRPPGTICSVAASKSARFSVRQATRVTVLESATTPASGTAQDMAPLPKEVRDVEREERQSSRCCAWLLARLSACADIEVVGFHPSCLAKRSNEFLCVSYKRSGWSNQKESSLVLRYGAGAQTTMLDESLVPFQPSSANQNLHSTRRQRVTLSVTASCAIAPHYEMKAALWRAPG